MHGLQFSDVEVTGTRQELRRVLLSARLHVNSQVLLNNIYFCVAANTWSSATVQEWNVTNTAAASATRCEQLVTEKRTGTS